MSVRKTPSAFTLIELLVVVGIIAVLMGLLLPSLARARGAAKSTTCQANMKSIASGIRQYSMDNEDSLPYTFATSPYIGWEANTPFGHGPAESLYQ